MRVGSFRWVRIRTSPRSAGSNRPTKARDVRVFVPQERIPEAAYMGTKMQRKPSVALVFHELWWKLKIPTSSSFLLPAVPNGDGS